MHASKHAGCIECLYLWSRGIIFAVLPHLIAWSTLAHIINHGYACYISWQFIVHHICNMNVHLICLQSGHAQTIQALLKAKRKLDRRTGYKTMPITLHHCEEQRVSWWHRACFEPVYCTQGAPNLCHRTCQRNEICCVLFLHENWTSCLTPAWYPEEQINEHLPAQAAGLPDLCRRGTSDFETCADFNTCLHTLHLDTGYWDVGKKHVTTTQWLSWKTGWPGQAINSPSVAFVGLAAELILGFCDALWCRFCLFTGSWAACILLWRAPIVMVEDSLLVNERTHTQIHRPCTKLSKLHRQTLHQTLHYGELSTLSI